jgi:hypothetical protein
MFFQLSSLARAGVIALAALGSLPAEGAPLGPVGQPVVADSPVKLIPVAQGEGRDCGPGYACNPRNPPVRNGPDGDDGDWNNGDERRHDAVQDDDDDDNGWNDDNGRNDDRRWRRHRRHHSGNDFEFGLGIGVAPDEYDDGYYDEPIYRPRYKPVYRGGGSAHVEWCYDRYRSYRAWDNSWQPNHGRRRQCVSPYS